MGAYIEYMNGVIEGIEQRIFELYHALSEVNASVLNNMGVLKELLEEEIQKLELVVDKYYGMFKEVEYVEADMEFELNRPQTIVEDITKGENK